MFRLFSKESNIFSIPIYIVLLIFMINIFNPLIVNTPNIISAAVAIIGIFLGFFCINSINLNYRANLPLLFYTILIITFYPKNIEIGIAMTLFANSIILLLLYNQNLLIRNNSFVLIGAIIAVNFIFFPTVWLMIVFIISYIIAVSNNIFTHIFRIFFGAFLVFVSYLEIAYLLDFNSWDSNFFRLIEFKNFNLLNDLANLYWLFPIAIMLIYSIINHFFKFNKQTHTSRSRYAVLLIFLIIQIFIISIYMKNNYEYMLFLAIPVSIILSRMLKFLPKYWMKEMGFGIVIFCLIIYKLSDFL